MYLSIRIPIMQNMVALGQRRLNTAFYWHLRPSLLLAGPDQLTDTRWIDTLFEGRVADGRTLCRWALDKVRYENRDCQINLLRGLTTSELKAGTTCAQLKAHAIEMHEVIHLICFIISYHYIIS